MPYGTSDLFNLACTLSPATAMKCTKVLLDTITMLRSKKVLYLDIKLENVIVYQCGQNFFFWLGDLASIVPGPQLVYQITFVPPDFYWQHMRNATLGECDVKEQPSPLENEIVDWHLLLMFLFLCLRGVEAPSQELPPRQRLARLNNCLMALDIELGKLGCHCQTTDANYIALRQHRDYLWAKIAPHIAPPSSTLPELVTKN